jgi:hypothetical protein
LLESALDISARKKLIHAMPLNTDRPIDHARVVKCAISATRNSLKLHMPRTLNPLWATFVPKRKSCGSVLRCGLPLLDPVPSVNPPTAR